MIPLSLYIHIPWCEKKCPYCDFNSHLAKTVVDQQGYINTLIDDFKADINTYETALQGRKIQSIFIGGGTPSLFDAQSFDRLLNELQEHCEFTDDIEITLEANPGSSEAEKFKGFRQAGINRLSIGIQSFNAQHLSALGRVHNSNEALNAARYAHSAGFDNFNLDLMFGLPEQSIEQSIADVRQAIDLNPTHLSCYQLTIEPNTLFHHHPPVTPDDDALWDMQVAIQAELTSNDFQQYEVSAYAKPNKQCRHNVNYWQFGDYLGIGAGAHGKITDQAGSINRYWKIKHPSTYLAKDNKVGEYTHVPHEQLPFEFMMNAMRLSHGFDLDLFTQRTGLSVGHIQAILNKHKDLDLITTLNSQVAPTARGKQMLNHVLEDYLP
ncbi:UNVERIFIED_CONTAM: hypothetical protein GTU68_056503 [Idotea baltica]|nr:hypothetical protein [Idotea baltica]